MLLDAEFLKLLDEVQTRTDGSPRRRRSDRLWRPLRKKDARPRSRLERFVSRLLHNDSGPIVFLIDATQTMTFTEGTPPLRSSKFAFARKFVAAVGYTALRRGISVRVLGFSATRGRRAPALRDGDPEAFLGYLETLRPGGNGGFGYALRNELLRGGAAGYFVILSDFRDNRWQQGIPALVSGEARVALVQIVDRNEPEPTEPELAPEPTEDELMGDDFPELWTAPPVAAEDINARLVAMAREHRLELVALLTDAPVEETILSVVGRA